MKRRAALLLAVLCCVGCIDEFTTPLDPQPVGQLDPRLIGVWACVPTGPASDFHPKDRDGRKGTFAVFEFGASGPWYRIRTVGLDQADREEFWDAYPSTLGDRTVLNVWPNSDRADLDGSGPFRIPSRHVETAQGFSAVSGSGVAQHPARPRLRS